jgi:hypothetical protein
VKTPTWPKPNGELFPVVFLLLGVATLGLLSALLVRSACLNPGPPVELPVSGTPRASYCDVVSGVQLWLLLVAAPLLACIAALAPAKGRVRWWVVIVAALAAGTALVNVGVVHSLTFAYTL